MKITRNDYFGSPCFKLKIRGKTYADLDWNTRRPGLSLWAGTKDMGLDRRRWWDLSFCLEVNAPLGEPHRLYLNAGRKFHAIVGLWPGNGCYRYRYHQDEAGEWVRNDRPAPLHWGWLTINL